MNMLVSLLAELGCTHESLPLLQQFVHSTRTHPITQLEDLLRHVQHLYNVQQGFRGATPDPNGRSVTPMTPTSPGPPTLHSSAEHRCTLVKRYVEGLVAMHLLPGAQPQTLQMPNPLTSPLPGPGLSGPELLSSLQVACHPPPPQAGAGSEGGFWRHSRRRFWAGVEVMCTGT